MWILSFSVYLNYKSEKGRVHGDKCHFRYIEAEGQTNKKSKKGGAERISCDIEGVYAVGLCVLRLLLVKVYSTWTWKIGIKSHRQMLQRHMAPNSKFGKEKGPSRRSKKVCLLSVVFLRAGIKGNISWKDFAPRKMRPQSSEWTWRKYSKMLKNSDNITFNIFGDVKGMPALTISRRDQMSEHSLSDSTRMLFRVGQAVNSHDWPRNGKRIFCKTDSFVPLVVPSSSVNSGNSSSSATLPQESLELDAHFVSGNRAAVKFIFGFGIWVKWRTCSKETSAGISGRWQERCERSVGGSTTFWLEDFTDNLEVTDLLAPAHSSRDSDSEHTPKVVS